MADEQQESSEKQNPGETTANIKTQIEEVEKNLRLTQKIVQEIQKYYATFEEIKKKLDNEEDGLEVNLDWSQRTKGEMEVLKTNSQADLKSISDAVASTKKAIEDMDVASKDFASKKSQFDDGEVGLLAILNQAKNLKVEIEKVKTDAETILSQVQTILINTQTKEQDLDVTYKDFTATKIRIDDKETGLEAVLQKSQNFQQDIEAVKSLSDKLHSQITKYRDAAKDYVTEISGFKEQAQTDKGLIETFKTQSEDFKNKITEFYGIATGTTLGGSFSQRKTELSTLEVRWFSTLIVSALLLAVSVLFIYFTSRSNGSISSTFWYRLTFTSPLIFMLALSTERYANERNLLEKYAFKAATALALESYTTLLKKTFTKEEQETQILTFVLTSMGTIYKEPFELKKETKWGCGLK